MPNNVPFVPQLTGVVTQDIDSIIQYLHVLNRYLCEGEPDSGWSVAATLANKEITPTMSLLELVEAFATLIRLLRDKGIILPWY
jgi:hypothetical protein